MIDDIESAIQTKNSEKLEMAAHRLKGALASLYANPARQLAWKLEQAAHDRTGFAVEKSLTN